ncbi:hypothetical protein CHGG_05408 [Chaetomium globosum CBS 148.51]|uniref:Rhodopsin domain-containing protein n=1 Tax=Chaetomium globosum (strain ATCC 6205 / CBS 148.51 / DSM 1962 / NBRC 6347 / NRRL 1970) TaxID=306901 RepID=Q2H7F7_CHAGB|nr:uncharacterized protein CHGG_05408 [Chaetomium globosum CBS 148.51]EAQ88789.1 hypothetical protein CHGG_05408 [Chaetomium globosum CBS 148.51]
MALPLGAIQVVVVSYTATTLSIVALALRLWSKNIQCRHMAFHNHMVCVSMAFTAGARRGTIDKRAKHEIINSYSCQHSSFGRPPTPCVNISILSLYTSLFPSWRFILLCYGTMVVTLAYFISVLVETFVLCNPVQYNWDKTIAGTCEGQNIAYLISGITNLVIGVFVIAMLMPMLFGLHMSLRKRLGVIEMFSLGGVHITVSREWAVRTVLNDTEEFSGAIPSASWCPFFRLSENPRYRVLMLEASGVHNSADLRVQIPAPYKALVHGRRLGSIPYQTTAPTQLEKGCHQPGQGAGWVECHQWARLCPTDKEPNGRPGDIGQSGLTWDALRPYLLSDAPLLAKQAIYVVQVVVGVGETCRTTTSAALATGREMAWKLMTRLHGRSLTPSATTCKSTRRAGPGRSPRSEFTPLHVRLPARAGPRAQQDAARASEEQPPPRQEQRHYDQPALPPAHAGPFTQHRQEDAVGPLNPVRGPPSTSRHRRPRAPDPPSPSLESRFP